MSEMWETHLQGDLCQEGLSAQDCPGWAEAALHQLLLARVGPVAPVGSGSGCGTPVGRCHLS